MRKDSKIIKEFLSLDEQKRNAIFEIPYGKIPSIETRTKILRTLPTAEAVRIIENVNCIEMYFILERILGSKGGKKYLLKIFPEISSPRLASILFDNSSFGMNWDKLFNFLPVDVIVRLVDAAIEKALMSKANNFYVFYPIKFLVITGEDILKNVLLKMKPLTFEVMITDSTDLGQRRFLGIASTFPVKRIVKLCEAFDKPVWPCVIIAGISNPEKQKQVLLLVSQVIRDSFFTKNSKNANVKSSDIIVANLKLKAKKAFVKQFPRSKQISQLPFEERLEVLFAS